MKDKSTFNHEVHHVASKSSMSICRKECACLCKYCRGRFKGRLHMLDGRVRAHDAIFLRRRKQNNFISHSISLYQAMCGDLTREGLFDEN